MKRLLSSRTTFFWKFIFPLVWSGGLALITLYLFTHTVDSTGKPIPPMAKWVFLGTWLIGTLFILWLVASLKRVFKDDTYLYISNYQTEITVPLSHIAEVRENKYAHIGGKHPITVKFSTPTLFGCKITFIPTGKAPFAWPWQKRPHPVTAELTNRTSC